jgi:hypothetical protein
MKADDLLRGLIYEKRKLDGKKYDTFELNVYEMIDDCIRTVRELMPLAEIGKATEKAFEEQYIEFVGEGDYNPNAVSDLLSWYREQATT